MRSWQVADIVQATRGTLLRGEAGRAVGEVRTDSRTLQPGELFVALRGERFDGHQFVDDAVRRGAAAVVISDAGTTLGDIDASSAAVVLVQDTLTALQDLARVYRGQLSGTIVAITGSNGKTTVKEMTAAVLQVRYTTFKAPGNLNNHIGLPLALLRMESTHEVGVFELGMNHLGEIRQLCTIARPHIGVVTNIGLAHVGYLGSIEHIQQAKGELVESLDDSGIAIVNADDPRARALRRWTSARVVTFGETPGTEVRGWLLEDRGLLGIRCRLQIGGRERDVNLALPGRHILSNALAAAAVGLAVQVPLDDIVTGLQAYRGIYGRLMVRRGRHEVTVIDDTYNANPQSMRTAVQVLARAPTAGQRLAVLGDMLELGDAAPILHWEIGTLAAASALQHLIALGPLARYIAEGAQAAGMPASRVHAVDSLQEALALLAAIQRPGDVVLVKGSRGMAMERLVAAMVDEAGEP
jgi:UDP-N-acetylmuramoyl-tripeptide--D-alanyl-D-alanine ligase